MLPEKTIYKEMDFKYARVLKFLRQSLKNKNDLDRAIIVFFFIVKCPKGREIIASISSHPRNIREISKSF